MSPRTFAHRWSRCPVRGRLTRASGMGAVALLGVFLAAGAAVAQEGTVTGTVLNRDTGAPLQSVQVSLLGTGMGTLSRADGRYILLRVPAGTYTIRATRIGYTTESREVTVPAEGTATVNFDLEEEVLGLDEIVVTGQAGSARRREVGNSISMVRATEIAEPVVNVEGLLQGRAAGLNIGEVSGSVGSGSFIRLRGNVSVSQSNFPLVYIDGVRVRSEPYPKNVPPTGYSGRSYNATPSPLNDINPADIERIEVIKGAAATTLYGTEASAGVIQIFTKRGQEGAARWTFQMDQGVAHNYSFSCHLQAFLESCGSTQPKSRLENWLRQAHRQKYSANVTGGTEDLTYFLSGAWEGNDGVLLNDREQRASFRGNFGFTPLSDLNVQTQVGAIFTRLDNTPSGNNAHGITLQTYRGDANYVGGFDTARIDEILRYDIDTDIDRVILSTTATHSPSSAFSHKISIGFDRANIEGRQLRPFGFILAPLGILSNRQWTGETFTADYAANLSVPWTDDFSTTFSWGGQAVETEEITVDAEAQEFPGPGDPTISSGAISLSFEDRIRNINAGFFGQARLEFGDRFFLTGGARADGNSFFGEGLKLSNFEVYPKVSASYVISDEEFWPQDAGDVKLRAAWGRSGRAPGAFDAVRTFDPVKLGTQSAFFPRNKGNPDLRPEVTSEIEIGADASWLRGRLTGDFTWYRQTTFDALFPVTQIPSEGDFLNQLENVGEMKNVGVELNVNAGIIQTRDWGWDFGVGLSTNHTEVLDLGGAPEFTLGGNAWIIEGEPILALKGEWVRNAEEFADPDVAQDTVLGPNFPTTIWTPHTTVRFPKGITLTARAEAQLGHFVTVGSLSNGVRRSTPYATCLEVFELKEAGRESELPAFLRFHCNIEDPPTSRGFIFPSDFVKMREITARFPLDVLMPQGKSATLTLSARNAMRWFAKKFPELDPELGPNAGAGRERGGDREQVRTFAEHVPPPAIFTASLRVNF